MILIFQEKRKMYAKWDNSAGDKSAAEFFQKF